MPKTNIRVKILSDEINNSFKTKAIYNKNTYTYIDNENNKNIIDIDNKILTRISKDTITTISINDKKIKIEFNNEYLNIPLEKESFICNNKSIIIKYTIYNNNILYELPKEE